MTARIALFFCLLLTGSPFRPLLAGTPVIAHDPPASVTAEQPLRVVARVRVDEDVIRKVSLYVAQTGDTAPVAVPMNAAGAGVYYGNIPPALFAGVSEFKYYIDAHAASGEWVETEWIRVQVIGGAVPAREEASESSIKKPLLVIGGGVAVVAGGLALSGGGGGGSGSGDGSGSGGGEVGDLIITRSASDRVNAESPGLPAVTTIEAEAELAGRTVDSVRIRFEFDALDQAEKSFAVLYGGTAVISGASSGQTTEQVQPEAVNNSTEVQVHLLDAAPGENGNVQYSWNATVTYFLAP